MKARDAPFVRVERACRHLKASGKPVSLASICRTARCLDGHPLANTTILDDPMAAAIYRANRAWKPPPKRKHSALFSDLPGDLQHHALNLLKRKKWALVRLVIALEAERAHNRDELRYLRSLEPAQCELPSLPVEADVQLGYIHALLLAGRTFDAGLRPGNSRPPDACGGGSDAP
jgi:hypothetical protein